MMIYLAHIQTPYLNYPSEQYLCVVSSEHLALLDQEVEVPAEPSTNGVEARSVANSVGILQRANIF